MDEGLLWYDDDPRRELAEKIGRAARRYRQKFGASPDVCYVHPSTLGGDDEQKIGPIHLSPSPSILRHHFWLGREVKKRRAANIRQLA